MKWMPLWFNIIYSGILIFLTINWERQIGLTVNWKFGLIEIIYQEFKKMMVWEIKILLYKHPPAP